LIKAKARGFRGFFHWRMPGALWWSADVNRFLAPALCFALAACATTRPPAPEPAAPGPVPVGTVAYVNEEDGFVLVRAHEIPEPGTPLQTRAANGEATALLRVSPEQRRPFLIADIVQGDPHVGETVTR